MARSLAAGRRVTLAARRPVRRRRRGASRSARRRSASPRARRRDGAGRHRRDLRRDQGRVRGHALDPRAGRARSAIAGVKALGRAARRAGTGRCVAIACGANMNFDRLRFVAERAELGEQREAMLRGDDPRAARQLPRVLRAARHAQRHRVQLPLSPTRRRRTSSSASRSRAATRPSGSLRSAASDAASTTLDLTDNEMAKLHVRHMVGGHAPARRARDPLPLRVSRAAGRADALPRQHERAAGTSACSTTATTAPTTAACWSACRCRPSDKRGVSPLPRRLGYDYVDETANPAYRMFLGRLNGRAFCRSPLRLKRQHPRFDRCGTSGVARHVALPLDGSRAVPQNCSAAAFSCRIGRDCPFRQGLCSRQAAWAVADSARVRCGLQAAGNMPRDRSCRAPIGSGLKLSRRKSAVRASR